VIILSILDLDKCSFRAEIYKMNTHISEAGWAYALARIGFGINIALHGWVRISAFADFEAHLLKQFAESPLPAQLVSATAYLIVAGEAVFGTLILFGLGLRWALIGGGALMWVLIFGTCLIQNWTVAGSQIVYLAFFAGLLALARHDAFSLDAWMRTRRAGIAKP